MSKPTTPASALDGCRRCDAPKQAWQVYCGAACCVAYEAGDRVEYVENLRAEVERLRMVAAPTWAEDTIADLRALVAELVGALEKHERAEDFEHGLSQSGYQPSELIARARQAVGK